MSVLRGELLPGIPNEITLSHIATKLAWRDFLVLSSVSQNWQLAIQNRDVYRERLRSHSSEELLVVLRDEEAECRDDLHRDCTFRNAVSLYSMREKAFYQLPPIPHLRGSSRFCQFVASSGNLYVCTHNRGFENSGNKGNEKERILVYVLDVAAQRQWKECTNIQGPEREDALRLGCRFKAGEEHTFVADGSPDYFTSKWEIIHIFWGYVVQPRLPQRRTLDLMRCTFYPQSHEVECWVRFTRYPRVLEQGKSYMMKLRRGDPQPDIYIQDSNSKLWIHQHTISWAEITREIRVEIGENLPNRYADLPLFFTVAPVNNELLGVICYPGTSENDSLFIFIQSKGFGSESPEIVWQRVPDSANVDARTIRCMCPIVL